MKTELKLNFKTFSTDAKGNVQIVLTVKGDLKDSQILALHRLKAAGSIFGDLYDGQADIDDYPETPQEVHKGIPYTVDGSGIATAKDPDQLDMDTVIGEVEEAEKQAAAASEDGGDVVDDTVKEDSIVSVEVLQQFKYDGKQRKKGVIVQMPKRHAVELEGIVKILDTEQPF